MLFVNNRVRICLSLVTVRYDVFFQGEKMENLDEKHVEMLRTNLSVYEVDGIQCQLTFQKKTITLDVIHRSSFFFVYL